MKRKEEFGNTNKILENAPLSKMYTGVLNQGKKIPKTRRNEHELQRKQKKALFGRLRHHGTVSVRKNNRIRCANGGKTAIGKGKLLWRELEKWEGSKNEN